KRARPGYQGPYPAIQADCFLSAVLRPGDGQEVLELQAMCPMAAIVPLNKGELTRRGQIERHAEVTIRHPGVMYFRSIQSRFFHLVVQGLGYLPVMSGFSIHLRDLKQLLTQHPPGTRTYNDVSLCIGKWEQFLEGLHQGSVPIPAPFDRIPYSMQRHIPQ
ncbi:MAG: hypothetical protein GY696_24555, partial [Gammaproteobacteria bacterium]|nr:hypothetical protein [Gammaproteobacteria bacterium]